MKEITEATKNRVRDRLKESIIAYIECYPEYISDDDMFDPKMSLNELTNILQLMNDRKSEDTLPKKVLIIADNHRTDFIKHLMANPDKFPQVESNKE